MLGPRRGNSSVNVLGLWGSCTCHCSRGAAPVTLQSSAGLLWVCVSSTATIPALQCPVVKEQAVREWFVLPRNVHRAGDTGRFPFSGFLFHLFHMPWGDVEQCAAARRGSPGACVLFPATA